LSNLSEVNYKRLFSQATLQFWPCGWRQFWFQIYIIISDIIIFTLKEENKERTRKKNNSYFREGKSHSNCSDNNKMVPEPLPNSIQAASNVDFTLQSQTLSKRAKPSLVLICGN